MAAIVAAVLACSPCFAADPAMAAPAPAQFKPALPLASAAEQVTFLYYADLAAPREFYGKVLGLQSYYDQEWVSLYRVTPGAAIGVVKASGHDLPPDTKRDAVMVSIVTPNVDEWFRKLKQDADVVVLKEIYDHPVVPIRAFLVQDPGGYSVEFFQWRR